MMIRVKSRENLASIVHGSVWRQPQFKWEPMSFMVENPKLESKVVEAEAQITSLSDFEGNPCRPMVYIVAGNPDDSKAKYFAAYLVSKHKAFLKHKAEVIWESVYGGFDNKLLNKDIEPTMLVISNVTENSTNLKYEKVRDLIERWPNIPRIVVCVGEDPISFAATKLFVPAHGVAYFTSNIVKSVKEII